MLPAGGLALLLPEVLFAAGGLCGSAGGRGAGAVASAGCFFFAERTGPGD
jgi:hypothetical protein